MATTTTTTTMPRPKRRSGRIRRARHAAGLTLAQLAARCGLSLSWVSLLEREPAFLTPRTAALLAHALGLSVEEVVS